MDFEILGPLQVRTDVGPVEIRSARQRVILAVLIVNAGRIVSSDRLLEAVWGDDQPQSGIRSLRFHIWKLRSALQPKRETSEEGVIATRAPGYVLLADPLDIDAVRFQRMAAAAQAILATDPERAREMVGAALALWRGPALEDIADEEFARLEAIRLEELRRRAVEDRVEASLALGDHAAVVGELAALTLEYPMRERLWGQFMIALARCGRQAEALRAYQQLRRHLARELGIAPSAEVQEIELGIVTQAPQVVHPSTRPMADSLHGYLLREQMGKGAYGVVWRAIQPGSGREVAIKVIRLKAAGPRDLAEGFELRARRVAGLEHPNIVPLFDSWREHDAAYLVMPFMRGGNLGRAIRTARPPPGNGIALLETISDALAYAHRCGVVHGNLSPENVLLDDEGHPYVDFGITAMLLGIERGSNTPSLAYISPEQLAGHPPTVRSDVYALGALAALVLTGATPTPGAPTAALRSARPAQPGTLDAVLARATTALPTDRFDGPEALVVALGESLGAASNSRLAVSNPHDGGRAAGDVAIAGDPPPNDPSLNETGMPEHEGDLPDVDHGEATAFEGSSDGRDPGRADP